MDKPQVFQQIFSVYVFVKVYFHFHVCPKFERKKIMSVCRIKKKSFG